jgi:hypothetical protein
MKPPPTILLFCLFGTAAAQETATLSGSIWDATSSLVPGARITAVKDETGFRRSEDSSSDGMYRFPYLNPGHYKITVRRNGFRTLVQFGLKLEATQSARADFHLQVGSPEEVVTVTAEPPLFNTEDASVSTLVGHNWIENLPLNGRGLLTLLQLAPGSIITPATEGEAGQFTVNGQRANTGVSGGGLPAQMPGGSLPNMTAFGSFHDLISVESLDQIGSLAAELLAWAGNKGPDDFIFQREDGNPPDDRDLQQHVWRPAAETAGIYHIGFGMHTFRRLNVIWRQHTGATPIEAQKAAGHASLDMTFLYTQNDEAREREHVAQIMDRIKSVVNLAAMTPEGKVS